MSILLSLSSNSSIAGAYTAEDGTIDLNDYNLTVGGSVMFGDGLEVNGAGIVAVAGDILLDGVTLDGASLATTATIVNTGFLELANAGLQAADFVNARDATLECDTNFGFTPMQTLAGTIIGAGRFAFSGTVAAGTALDAAGFLMGSYWSLEGNEAVEHNLFAESTQLTLNGFGLTVDGTADLSAFYVDSAGTLDLAGTAKLLYVFMQNGAVLEDSGTVTGNIDLGGNASDHATLVIDSGGTFELSEADEAGGIVAVGTATMLNAGLIEQTGLFQNASISSGLTNLATGTIAITNGEITQGRLINEGLITIAAGTLDAAGGITGAPGATGQLDLGDFATAILAAGIADGQTISFIGMNADLILQDPAIFDAAISHFAKTDKIDLADVAAVKARLVGDILTIRDRAGAVIARLRFTDLPPDSHFFLAADGAGGTYVEAGQHGNAIILPNAKPDLWTAGRSGAVGYAGNWSNGVPTADSAVTISGTLGKATISDGTSVHINTIDSQDSKGTFAETGATLNIKAGGTIDGHFDQDAPATLILQAGLLDLSDGGTIDGAIDGRGTIELAGRFTLRTDATLGIATMISTGQLVLHGDQTIAGDVTLAGKVELQNHNLALTGDSALQGMILNNAGTLDISGRAVIGDASIDGAATLDDRGVMIQDGDIEVKDTASAVSMTIEAGATYDVEYDGGRIDSNVTVQKPYIENAGLFETKTDALLGVSFINAATGTIDAAGGIISFDGGTFGGTLTGPGDFDFTKYGEATFASAVISATTLAMDDVLDGSAAIAAASPGFDGILTLTGKPAGNFHLAMTTGTTIDIANVQPNGEPSYTDFGPGFTIAFNGASGLVHIAADAFYEGTIANFAAGDVIDLAGTELDNITGETFTNGVLTLSELVGSISLTFMSPSITELADFTLSAGPDGTEIEIVSSANAVAALPLRGWPATGMLAAAKSIMDDLRHIAMPQNAAFAAPYTFSF